MELPDLIKICASTSDILSAELPSHSCNVAIFYPESPNPVCSFHVEGECAAQGGFWANNEYSIFAMNTIESEKIMEEEGSFDTRDEAVDIVRRFCDVVRNSISSSKEGGR